MAEDRSNRLQVYIILFNCKEDVKTIEDIEEKNLQAINFIEIIENHFKKIFHRNGNHINIKASDYHIYLHSMAKNELTTGKQIDIYGENGLYEFITLAKENGWKIFDTGLNDFMDLDFPKKYSYLEYKESKNK